MKTGRLADRLFFYVLVFSSLLTLIISVVLVYNEYRVLIASIEEDFVTIQKGYGPPIASSLWVLDREQLKSQITGILSFPYMTYAVVESQGKPVVSSGSQNTDDIIQKTFQLNHLYNDKNITIGELKVMADLKEVRSDIISRISVILLYQTAEIFFVSLFIFFIVRHVVTKRLSLLAGHLKELGPHMIDAPLVIPGKKSQDKPDEIDHVVTALNSMSSDLRKAFNELNDEVYKRTLAEEKLSQEKENLSVTLRSIGDGVITTDTTGRVVMINKVAEDLTGWTYKEAAGRPLSEVFHIINEETRQTCDNPVDRVLQVGIRDELSDDTVLIKKDGGEIIIADSAAPIKEQEGKIIGVVLVFRDITYRKKAEEERIKLEEQLRQAHRMEAVGQLAGGIAHDFNNILMAIISFCYLVQQQSDLSANSREYLDDIQKSANRAAELTQGLLAYSRKQFLIIKPVELNKIIKDVEKLLLRIIGEDIELVTSLSQEDISVKADKAQLENVLINLAANARDAMPEGGKLSIGTSIVRMSEEQAEVKPGIYALITVSDTGIGIDKDIQNKIFEPFFTTKEVGKGTGLGLAMAYGIIKQHEGFITVYSESGIGAIFSIYLPLYEVGNGERAEQSAA